MPSFYRPVVRISGQHVVTSAVLGTSDCGNSTSGTSSHQYGVVFIYATNLDPGLRRDDPYTA
jgi:hypothetical protein